MEEDLTGPAHINSPARRVKTARGHLAARAKTACPSCPRRAAVPHRLSWPAAAHGFQPRPRVPRCQHEMTKSSSLSSFIASMRSKTFSPHHLALLPLLLTSSHRAPPMSRCVEHHQVAIFMCLMVVINPRPHLRSSRHGSTSNSSTELPPHPPRAPPRWQPPSATILWDPVAGRQLPSSVRMDTASRRWTSLWEEGNK
jgi:hypothetical protein